MEAKEVWFDKKGNLLCPECRVTIKIPPTHYLGRGIGKCPKDHYFNITDRVALAVNEILGNKEQLKDFEETPPNIVTP